MEVLLSKLGAQIINQINRIICNFHPCSKDNKVLISHTTCSERKEIVMKNAFLSLTLILHDSQGLVCMLDNAAATYMLLHHTVLHRMMIRCFQDKAN